MADAIIQACRMRMMDRIKRMERLRAVVRGQDVFWWAEQRLTMTKHTHSHSLERCGALLAQLNDYLDGELPPGLCAELDAHLADCPDCTVVLDTLGMTIQIVRTLDLEPPSLPPGVEDRLLARLGLVQDTVTPATPGGRRQ